MEKEWEKEKEFEEFCSRMQCAVQACFPLGTEVEIRKVVKNNALALDSLVILEGEQNLSPHFYLQSYYEKYQDGMDFDDLVLQIKEIYEMAAQEYAGAELDLSYGACADRVTFRLVSYEKNKALLQDHPHIRFLDLAIVFYLLINRDADGVASIRISNDLQEQWGLEVSELYALAKKNTERLFPARMCSLRRMMEEMIKEQLPWEGTGGYPQGEAAENDFCEPYILTNESGMNGAAVILYPDLLKKIGETLGTGFYLLPSSIHEILVISDHTTIREHALSQMVRDVNESCVSTEDLLSNAVYRYDREADCIRIVKKGA